VIPSACGNEGRPRRHQFTSPFEQVSAPLGYFSLVLEDLGERGLEYLADKICAF
jgi:hypothetical protein